MSSTSVVMTCYNGVSVIRRQLDSLRNQTKEPDEVLIFDDASADKTAELVEEYIKKYHLDSWKLIRNKENLGWKENFFRGALQCSYELIFFCDQDDEWQREKIEKMADIIGTNKNMNILACDYSIHYGLHSVPMKKYRKKRKERTGPIGRYQFTTRFFQNPSPGCTYAVRKSFLHDIKRYWFPEAPHDEFIWLFAIMTDSAWFCNENLMTVFRGESNASDIKYKDIEMQIKNVEYIHTMMEILEEYVRGINEEQNSGAKDLLSAEQKTEILKEGKKWCVRRMTLLKKRNPFLWLCMMPYRRYYNSFRNCLSDLYLVLFGSFRR